MNRFKLTIEYDGTPFCGWQRQKNAPSVQQSLEEAIKAFTGQDVTLHTAGRTDTGVHATGQVAHVDLAVSWQAYKVREALNYHIRPHPIAIIEAVSVSDAFHARFSAQNRHYIYKILNRRAQPVLQSKRVWHVKQPLDADKMHEAAQTILGKHDFTTFRNVDCQAKSPVKSLDKLAVTQIDDALYIEASAPSFLHNQVRSLVGSLVEVGLGKWPVEQMRQVLDARKRSLCGPVAPPHGLYLHHVDYPIEK